jgi:3'-phosphoadenosine 5'-phosphosulfate sulfotransferase (PAPS reductase)/FAD synthetase
MNKKIHIASLSGGQDSTAMIVRMLELGMPLDYIVFCDTGAEFDVMYEYLEKLGRYLNWKFDKEITILDGQTYEDIVKRPLGEKAKPERIGKPKGITRVIGADSCTRDLKVNRIKKFAKSLKGEVIFYNGYTYNEVLKNRGNAKENMKHDFRYPLYDWKWNEKDISEYLKKMSIYNSLYNHYTRTGCFLCPKQSEKSWFTLWKHYNHHFEYAKSLEKWCLENDAVSKNFVYRSQKQIWIPLVEIEKEFIEKDKMNQTFDFSEDQEEISCMCK